MYLLLNGHKNANLNDLRSIKSGRAERSVVRVETFALADAGDSAIIIQRDTNKIKNWIPITFSQIVPVS